jgi:hypothetical protein
MFFYNVGDRVSLRLTLSRNSLGCWGQSIVSLNFVRFYNVGDRAIRRAAAPYKLCPAILN